MRTLVNQKNAIFLLWSLFLNPVFMCDAGDAFIDGAEKTEKTKSENANAKKKKKSNGGKRPAVDLAILLDTSNSMDGLISQARNQLWTIVQQIAEAERNGQKPMMRVAVFEYGNSKLPASEDYLRQVVQLTDDLDKVSEGLFTLETDGGDEYCGAVIEQAIARLDWSTKRNAYKAIYIAGNEPFNQGEVRYEESCRAAIENGIIVNTIHCGNYDRGVAGGWKRGADLAEGKFMNINQDRKVEQIKTPQDPIIIQLNVELNRTYLWYGENTQRKSLAENQVKQDQNAISAGASISRIATKAGQAYSNRGRDLVDSLKVDSKVLDKISVELLPEEMQKMTLQQRKNHVAMMATKRAEIQKKISEANKLRADFLDAQQKASPAPADATFGEAIGNSVETQLEEFGFEVK